MKLYTDLGGKILVERAWELTLQFVTVDAAFDAALGCL